MSECTAVVQRVLQWGTPEECPLGVFLGDTFSEGDTVRITLVRSADPLGYNEARAEAGEVSADAGRILPAQEALAEIARTFHRRRANDA